MKFLKPGALIFGLVLLTSCSRLPSGLRSDIAYEGERVGAAEHQLQQSQQTLAHDLAQAPDLFRDASAPAQWNARLQSDREKLASAEKIQSELADLARRGRRESQFEAEQLLRRERQLLASATSDSQAVIATAGEWLDFEHNPPAHLAKMRREYDTICHFDLAPVTKDIEQAEHDWPAKKAALEERLNALRAIPKQVETEWESTQPLREAAAAGKADGKQLATLIQTDETFAGDENALPAKSAQLESLSGQLYYAWDKILTDLDEPRYGGEQVFRERIKTIRTHFANATAKNGETTSEERWVKVSEPEFRAVENDLGMAIAHKDAGLFDSEAQTTPQPAGFAYIAPETQGSNQYGYWTHAGGHSVWTWLPEYLILRDLLWNHDYRPVIADEYRRYRSAQTAGKTYYGQTTPAAPPKYGTHGTFTETHYAGSRYAQQGGFAGSRYASHPGAAASASRYPARSEPEMNNNGAGRRFGAGSHEPSGHQFGRPGGFRGMGRSFGRRR